MLQVNISKIIEVLRNHTTLALVTHCALVVFSPLLGPLVSKKPKKGKNTYLFNFRT